MTDDRRPPPAPQESGQDSGNPDLTDAYTAARQALTAHVQICYACRRRGTDCYDVLDLKARLRETQSASIAARPAAR